MSLSDTTSNFSNLSLTNESYVDVPSEHASNVQHTRQAEPPVGTSVAGDRLLKLALPADKSDTEMDRYAVVPIPDSYEKAQSIALEVFRRHIPGDVMPHDLILKTSVKNRKGEWCWADIRPQDWPLTIKDASDEVGVFYKRPVVINVPLAMFTLGKVRLVYGAHSNRGIDWKTGYKYPRNANEISDMMIDRPRSYEEAVAIVRRLDRSDGSSVIAYDDAVKEAIRSKHLKFYWFSSVINAGTINDLPVASWFIEFPETAYTDENVWRTIVPEPGKLLGFTLEDSSPA